MNKYLYDKIREVRFQNTFLNSVKLQQNRNIFFADGEESTRFLNQNVSFSSCLRRNAPTGIQGEAPKLWDVDFGTGTPVKTNCWGAADSGSSLSNYDDIPVAWLQV